ncbi:metallophosphoesterase, partial [Selenomonadales bacterium OttesenSCG-928-I06]|nr:metallophosphoesterase [Selenomonadales bacterium OttesenSCG-928-I06]
KAVDTKDKIISRRNFLKRSIVFLPFISLIISIKGIFGGNSEIVLNKVKTKIQGLPSNLNNFKIAHFSDVHLGAYFKLDKLEKIINMVKEEKPDVLVITGDLLDEESLLPEALKKIEAFAATLPCKAYFCYGNHEYFKNIKFIVQEFNKCPSIQVLKNKSDTFFYNDVAINILGVDYPFYSRHKITSDEDKYKLRDSYIKEAKKDITEKGLNILLAHHSDFLENAFNNKIDITFAGHTHGGQISLFNKVLLPISFKYMRGSYFKNGCFGYVSTGAGHWFPCRLNCPAEVTIFTLTT